MKPSDDPRCPFNENYKAQINWRPMQALKNASETMTKNLEQSRLKDPLHDVKQGISSADRLMPKLFHVYTKAGVPK